MKFLCRLLGSVLILIVLGLGLARGVKLGHVSEVQTNASYLCLSCIGIG